MNSAKKSVIHEIHPHKRLFIRLGERPNFLDAVVLTMQLSGAIVGWFVSKFIL
jgi:hypothetical protein